MILPILKPEIIIFNQRKIHVCRKPGFIAWLLLGLSTIIFAEISWQLTRNLVRMIVLLFGLIMFILDGFGEWQDLLLDKDENKATIERYNWIDKLYFTAAYDSCVSMKLSDIRYIGVTVEKGLFILEKNGKIKCLSMQGFTRNELQELKKRINYFLSSN
ncbi:uncharacterized protein LOC117606153 [Osmia lignaria lignaria]|uniref:uncharacterized protein LOC117606153 n=1 Tax=Osmia lignaria lignaria TaxID=1437193 RepID=UPI00402BEFD0